MDFKDLIFLVEQVELAESAPEREIIEEDIVEEDEGIDVPDRLRDLIFKMRAYSEPLQESVQGDYCMGVESGLEMAAEMLENLLREMGE